jgi:acyl transferase domain-containing protein/NADPH:quinone reductase-like Zn-dependent oxidoreductase/NADP-dependent 3-hydroxy acid dehydrogenase YdfG/acyl carrier protein
LNLVLDELQKDFETSQVNKAVYSQPLCTALQIALVDLLDSWNIRPNSVTGHSSGEIAAAYCSGAISLENAMLVAYARGCATTDLATKGVDGAMVAVGMTREELSPILSDLRNGKAVIACSNSPSSITVSGDKSALDELQQVLREQGVYNRRLVVGVAYHSHHMTLVADSYRAAISNFKASEGNGVDFFSSVTGKLSEKSKLGPEYWVSNLVGEVKFAQSLRQMGNHQGADSTSQVQTLVEIGPHAALAGPIKQILEADEGLAKLSIDYLAILTRKKDAVTTALTVASTLFLHGHTVQMSAVNRQCESKIPPLIDLPSYAWNHTRTYSAESRISKAYREREHPKTDLLGVLDVHSSTLEPRWRQIIRLSELPWVRDHKIQSTVVYPAAGYITMAMEAARQRVLRAAAGTQILGYQFRDVNISSALLIPETPGQVEVTITLKAFSESVRSPSNLWDEFSVSSVSSENRWTEHCRGLIAVQTPPKTSNPVSGRAHEDSIRATNKDLVENLETICQTPVEGVELYSHLSQIGMQYGPTFANIHDVRSTPGHCISRVEIPDTKAVLPMQYEQVSVVHPCTLDSIFQTYLPALAEQMDRLDNPVIPVSIEDMFIADEFSRKPGDMLTVYSSTNRKDYHLFTAGITVFDGPYELTKRPVVHIGEMTLAVLDRDSVAESDGHVPPRAFNLKWAPDVEFLSKVQIIDVVGRTASTYLTKNIDVEAAGASRGLSENNRLAAGYLHLLAHKKPDLSMLTIGVQSGPPALSLLSLLSELGGGVAPFTTFHYTDAELDLDQGVKAKFPAWADSITFKDLKIESGIPQGTTKGDEEAYDVVVAFNVLGSSKCLSQTLSSASRLLVPGGRLVLVDHALESSLATLPQDPLPGFISSQDDPSTAESSSTVDFLARKVGYKTHQALSEGAMVFQKENEPRLNSNIVEVLIVVDSEAQSAVDLVRLQSLCEEIGVGTEIVPLCDANPKPTQASIVLSDLSRHVLAAPKTTEWKAIREMAHGGAGLLWITQGASGDMCSNPEAALVHGFTRTIRSETGDRPIVTLDLDSIHTLGAEAAAICIADVFQRMMQSGGGGEGMEFELIERDGVIQVPRLVEDTRASEKLQSEGGPRASKTTPSLQRLDEVSSSRLFVGTPGLLDSLHFAPDERTADHLESGQVEVEVKAAGINFKDVMMAMGQIQVDDLGCECSGVVSAVAGDIASDPHGLRVGDRVMCLSSGSFCTRLRLDARLAERIPDSMSFKTAAALPITHVTAYHSLHNIARLGRGETILIHAATGGLGQAFVEMSQLAGAEVFVTVGSAEKKKFIMDRFGLAEERILYSRDMSFASDVMRLTGGRGVDVIVNSLAGEALRQSWTCIAPYGRFVELGQRDITINTRLDMAPFARNASFTAYNLAYTMRSEPQAVRNVLVEVLALFSRGALRGPDPLETYNFSELQQAFRKMQTGRHMGKLVAIAKSDDMIKHIPVTTRGPLLRSDAAYLLVGGLGGIGRATALWMASRGARHLIFLNRSGLESEAARSTVSALQAAGCTATVYACDVADAAQLASTMDKARQQLPPIRGVIQGAMVLRDCMLDKMSLEDYLAVLRPKLHGTWNLHAHLPTDMDFFLMESSISGIIGNTSQGAYAAGNTFLDAFARYRRSHGQPATTIDIGAVSGIGAIAQNEELKEAMQRQGFDFTDETRLMQLLEFAIGNSTREPHHAHIITGLGAWHPETSLPALSTSMFSHYRMLSSCATNISNSNDTLRQTLKQSKNVASAVDVILAALVDQIVSHTGVPIENVSTSQSLQDYGIDSLAAVELRNWLSKEMESIVPIFELLAAESLAVLATKIAGRSRLVVSANGH